MRARVPIDQCFWRHVVRGDECWEWSAARYRNGYGAFHSRSRPDVGYAHRFSWELAHGPIPPGGVICHRCDNPPCVRPDHLFLGTHADNVADKVAKGRVLRGEQIGNSVLTEAAIRAIREEYAPGRTTHEELAAKYGVKRRQVGRIVARQRWAHVA